MASEKRKRRQRNPNIGSHPIKPNHYKLPLCVECLKRREARQIKRGYKAKIKHEGQELCVHHYAMITGKPVFAIPGDIPKKNGLIDSKDLDGTGKKKKKKEPTGDEFFREVNIEPVKKGNVGQMMDRLLGRT